MRKIICVLCCICIVIGLVPVGAYAAETGIIITCNDDKAVHEGGTWNSTSAEVVIGPTGEASMNTTAKNASVTYDLSEFSGMYDLYIYSRTYVAAATVVTVNVNGIDVGIYDSASLKNGEWICVGTYTLSDTSKLKITNTSGGLMRDAAIKVVSNATGTAVSTDLRTADDTSEIIISCNDGKNIYGGSGWTVSTNVNVMGPTGGTSQYTNNKDCSVTYDLSGVEAGRYDLYVYNLHYAHKSTDVVAKITSEGHVTSGHYDAAAYAAQNQNVWVALGTYTFGATEDSVTFTNQVALSFRDAAIKLVHNDSGEAVTPELTDVEVDVEEEIVGRTIEPDSYIILGSDADGFTMSGNWKKSGVQYPRGTGYYSSVVGVWAQWKLNLNAAEDLTLWYLVPSVTDTEDPALKVEIYAEGKTTTVELDFTSGEPRWIELGTFDFDGSYDEYVKVIKQEGTEGTTSRITNLRIGYASAVADENEEEETLNSVYTGTDKEILQRLSLLTGTEEGITEEYIQSVPTYRDLEILKLKLNGRFDEADAYTGTDTTEIDASVYAKMLLEQMGYVGGTDYAETDALSFFNEVVGADISANTQFTIDVLGDMTVSAFSANMKGEKRSLLGSVMNKMEPISETEYTDPSAFTEEMRAEREAAKNRERSLIYNNDGNDAYVAYDYYPEPFDLTSVTEEVSVENFLSKRTTGLEDSQVDSVFYCTGVYNSYHHTSEIADLRQRDWAPLLQTELGTDSMSIILNWCKENDREFMWSMRMNDVHDRQYEEEYLDSFKQENPEYLVSSRDTAVFDLKLAPGFWTSLDYAELGVRQRTYDLLREVLLNYDVDGIELDFSRSTVYFEQVVTKAEDANAENLERMNNLIRSIRTLVEQVSAQKGKPILLAIHVPDSMGYNKAIGLDVEQWMEEGLVDIVSIRSYGALQSMEDGLAEYDNYNVPVYLIMDDICRTTGYDWGKEAGLAYELGYDGVQIYNVFDPSSELFDILGSPETAVYDPDYTEKVQAESCLNHAVDAKTRFLTYNKASQNISFAESDVMKTYGDEAFTIVVNGAAEGSTVTYSSTNTEVATVEANTGCVTICGVGSTEIVASATATSTYNAATAKYTLTVTEALPDTSYTVAVSGTSSKVVGETASITITVNSEENSTYNAVDFTLTYDAEKLIAPTELAGYTLEDNNGTLRIYGYGEDKAVGTSLTLNFTAKAEGEVAVTLTSAKVDLSANAVTQDAPAAAITEASVTITVGGYTVSLPDDFSGEEVVASGEDYTFTAKNPYYDYEVEATMGGEAVEVVENEDGSFTVPAITGNLVITISSKTPKNYAVTINGDASGNETATYMTDYSFSVNKVSGYSYDVAVTIGGQAFTNMTVDGNTYTIPGANVTGTIVVTVTKTELPVTSCNITFAGNGAEDATGDATAKLNEDYTFSVAKAENYTYSITAKRGDEFIAVADNEDGTYTIAAEDVTGDITISIEKAITVQVNEAVKLDDSQSVFLIRISGSLDEGKVYAYDGNVMFWSDIHGWCYLVISTGTTADVEEGIDSKISMIDGTKVTVSNDGDVNGTGLVDINDAQLVYDIYNAKYPDFAIVSMIKFLRADVNGDGVIDTTDAAAVVSKIN